jgi:hypothetical protein
MTTTQITYRKGDSRYYVSVNGQQIGWVSKTEYGEDRGTWAFFASVRRTLHGERLSFGNRTRTEAVWNGIGHVRIYHGAKVLRLNVETMQDEVVDFGEETLRAAEADLLDRMYPATAGRSL